MTNFLQKNAARIGFERESRYFRINNPIAKKDALIYGGSEIARLEKSLPDEDPQGNLDVYHKLKTKLILISYQTEMSTMLEIRFSGSEEGEATVATGPRSTIGRAHDL